MKLPFSKYQGAGNDFIMVDQREQVYLTRSDQETIARLCDRHFGVGADGLILLQPHPQLGFEMVYFNSDGRESTMCGNGGRCFTAFLFHLGMVHELYRFQAIDGAHEARITDSKPDGFCWVELHMTDVRDLQQHGDDWVLHTGSPHYVRFTHHLAMLDMVHEGREIRNSPPFAAEGINVNFAQGDATALQIRTYERGVENETLACGTGVTATAIAQAARDKLAPGNYSIPVQALGGDLSVRFTRVSDHHFTDIWLCGPAQSVFQGNIAMTSV